MSAVRAMSRLADYQRDVVDLLFRKDFERPLSALARDDRERQRWRVYRRMARTRLAGAIDASFPRLSQIIALAPVVERWLDESPPRSPYLRDVAGELARWLRPEVLPDDAPEWTVELARHEWAMLEVSYAHEEQGAAEVRTASELSFERPAVLTPAHRILRARWSVHRLPDDDPRAASVPARWPASVVEGPFALCLYRDAASHEVRVLELSPIAAAILEEVAPGHRAVVEAVRAAAEREGFAIDAPFIEAFSELVADLVERGVWLGSRAD